MPEAGRVLSVWEASVAVLDMALRGYFSVLLIWGSLNSVVRFYIISYKEDAFKTQKITGK